MKKKIMLLGFTSMLTLGLFCQSTKTILSPTQSKSILKATQTTTDTFSFTSKEWADSKNSWTSGKGGNSLQDGRGVQVTTGTTGANATSNKSFSDVSQILITYSTNASKGAGDIKIKIGSNAEISKAVTSSGGTSDRGLQFDYNQVQTGNVKLTVDCTTNSIYVKSIAITYQQEVSNDSFAVNFYLNEDDDEAYSSNVVKYGELITEIDAPNKEDYVFNYWSLKNGTQFDFNTAINEGHEFLTDNTLNLYANYTLIPFAGFEALETKASLKFSYTDENHEYVLDGYAKVTDAATLEDGDEIIIVNETAKVALGQQNNNNFSTADYDINGTLITPSNTLSVLTIGEEEGGYSIKLGNEYLYAASSSKNYLKTDDKLTKDSTWSIEIVDGNANIVAQGSNTRNILRYNSQSSLFSCYDSGQEDVQIYKRQTSTVNSDFNITKVGLRFRIQIPTTTIYTELSTYSPTYGVAFYLGAANKVSPSYHYETCVPKAVDSNMQYALVIDNIPYTAWEQEITARTYVQINGKEYYAQSKTYSVKSIAEDYINNHSEDAAVNAHADVLLFLATFND